jgi:hypothetical protein
MKDFENMTTLENSYCKPQGESEWELIGLYNPVQSFFVEYIKGKKRYSSKPKSSKTEIPVQHFIDLFEDRIVPWRLEELGLKCASPMITVRQYEIDLLTIVITDNGAVVGIQSHFDSFGIRYLDNVKSYSDLLTLIKFLK